MACSSPSSLQSAWHQAKPCGLLSSHDHNRNNPPRPRQPVSGHGCLFGCLGALAVLLLPELLVSAYGAWFFYQGFRHDPVLQAVSELVRHDGMAEQVLGEDIRITGVEGNAFSFMSGMGAHSAYSVMLRRLYGPAAHWRSRRKRITARFMSSP